MSKLTPTEQATLDAVRQRPGNVHELAERTGRSRSGTDRALASLAKAGLITKVDTTGDAADGAPTRWDVAEPAAASDEPTDTAHADSIPHDGGQLHDESVNPDDAAAHPTQDTPGTEQPQDADADAEPAPHGQQPDDSAASRQPDAQPGAAQLHGGQPQHADPEGPPGAGQATPDEPNEDTTARPSDAGNAAGGGQPEQPKLCRGCRAQMPKICPCCWQKTPAFCGTCRKDMPQARRGEPGEPQVLSNGLPKLRPGELEDLVLKVMQEHPLPHHVGVTGWTGSRVAVFLPGRSTGAINNALEKLVRTAKAELIGDKPMRFTLPEPATPTDTTPSDTGAASNGADTEPHAAQPIDTDTDTDTEPDGTAAADHAAGSSVTGTPPAAIDAAPAEVTA